MGIRTIGRPKGYAYPIGLTLGVGLSNVAPTTTGGTITADGSGPTANMVHSFTTSGTFTSGFTGNVEYLVVAGGGAGGYGDSGGAGGAGGFRYSSGFPVAINTTYTVTVGAGGTSDPRGPTGYYNGLPGSNSVFGSITSNAGGGGGGGGGNCRSGTPGGSGGGGGDGFGGGSSNTPPLSPQGNSGGSAAVAAGGGGGGAGAAGGNGSPTNAGGCGGAGCTLSISGSPVTYAGGGGGGGYAALGGASGPGGGGCGHGCTTSATSGTANRGGGGGGGANGNPAPTNAGSTYLGGSGIVIVRYLANASVPGYSIN